MRLVFAVVERHFEVRKGARGDALPVSHGLGTGTVAAETGVGVPDWGGAEVGGVKGPVPVTRKEKKI